MSRVARTTAHDPRSHAMPESVREQYTDRAKGLYVEGKLTLTELEVVLDRIMGGELGPRAFRDWMESEYGIGRMEWVPDELFEGCTMYV